MEEEGLRTTFGGRVQVLSWPEEPIEGDNDEVDDVGVGNTIFGVFGVEGVDDGTNDGDVGWVGTGFWVVFIAQGFEESSE